MSVFEKEPESERLKVLFFCYFETLPRRKVGCFFYPFTFSFAFILSLRRTYLTDKEREIVKSDEGKVKNTFQ